MKKVTKIVVKPKDTKTVFMFFNFESFDYARKKNTFGKKYRVFVNDSHSHEQKNG